MKKYHYFQACIFTLVLFLLSGIPNKTKAQSEPDAIIEKQIKEYTLNEDGSLEYRHYRKLKLLTYNAIHRLYGETFIVYNSNYQKLNILDSYTLMKDGTKIKTPPNAFNEVLPRYAANAPAYNSLKEMVVTHTGLEVGATVILDYKLTYDKDSYPGLFASEVLAEPVPVEDMDFIVKIPVSKYLFYDLLNVKGAPVRNDAGKTAVYTWHFSNIPMHLYEPNQPAPAGFLPALMISAIEGHASLATWIDSHAAFKMESNDAMKAFAGKIAKTAKDELSAALRIQETLVSDFVYYGIPFTVASCRARTAKEVWSGGGGTSVEKALLLSSLLNAAGIEASPVAVVPEFYLQTFANPALWEDFAVKVQLKDGRTVFLSSHDLNDKNLLEKLPGKQFLPLTQLSVLLKDKDGATGNVALLNTEFSLSDKNVLSGNIELRLEGGCYPELEMARSEKKAGYFLGGGLSEKDVKDLKVNTSDLKTCVLNAAVEKDAAARVTADYYFLTIPVIERGIASWHLAELTSTRKSPFVIPFPVTEEIRMTVSLPKHLVLLSPLAEKNIVNIAGTLTQKVSVAKRTLTFTRTIQLNSNYKEPGYYEALNELLGYYFSKSAKELIFKKE